MCPLYPKPLPKNATIGLIAPSTPIYEEENYLHAPQLLKDLGYKVLEGKSCFAKRGYLAGEDNLRADDIQTMFENDTVDGIICLRGGSGASRLLSLLNYDRIAQNPKMFIGFSDITVLHLAFQAKCQMVTFHGPMAGHLGATGFRNPSSFQLFLNAVTQYENPLGEIINPDSSPFLPFQKGEATGILTGGNLTVLSQMIGTPYFPLIEGKILLLEAIGQKPFEIDAQLSHLKNAGIFDACAGILLGDFTKCTNEGRPSLSLEEIFHDLLPKNIPILQNVHAGHGWDKLTLPLNITYQIRNNRLFALEAAARI